MARGRVQRSSHSGSLSKLGLAQLEAGSLELELELEPEPGLPAHWDPSPHPLAHLLPAALPSDQVKGAPPTFPALFSPSCICLGGSGEGWIRVGPGTTIPREAPEADGKGKGEGR